LLFLLHRRYSIFTEGSAADRWNVIALYDGSSFLGFDQPMYTVNFMLIPSRTFQVVIPAVGNNMLLRTPLKAFMCSPYTAKLSHFTVRLHVSQLDDFRQTIEQFFESRNRHRLQVLELHGRREVPRVQAATRSARSARCS
jgi:hypothetical protein